MRSSQKSLGVAMPGVPDGASRRFAETSHDATTKLVGTFVGFRNLHRARSRRCRRAVIRHAATAIFAALQCATGSLEIACDDVRAACEPIVVASPLQNLIENALKYGRRDGVAPVIEVRAFWRAGMVLIEVEDRGPGIDATEAETLFCAFQRGVDGGEGVGLGLATARRLVESRGGSIGLRAGRFGGALFQIRLPADRLEEKNDDEAVTVPDFHA